MKSLKDDKDKEKDKSGQADKEGQEGSGLKTAGPEGEITAGLFCAVCYHDLLVNDSCILNPQFSALPSYFV
jgi:hypothetical protein